MTTLSESLFPPSNRRKCVKGRTSYTESAESIMCSENINIDADDSYNLDHNGYDCLDSNEVEDIEEEPVTIDLQAFLSENPLLTEPASDCGVDSNINLSDCHSQFRVTSYQPDLSSSVIENVLTSEPAVTCEKNVLPELAINSLLITEKSAGENESSVQSEDTPVAVTEESMSSKENVFVNGNKQSPKKFVKSKTHMGLSNPLKKYKNFVKMKDINKTSVKVFGKYPVVKCEKLDIENFMKKNNIKVRNWPLLHNNINKTKLSLNNSGTITKKLNPKKPNLKIPKLFKKPISFNKYISLPKSGSSVNKCHSILVDSLDAVAKSDMESDNFKLQVSPASSPVKNLMHKSSGSPFYQGHRFPNIIKQNPVCSQKLVKIIPNDSYSQGNDSVVQPRKLPIITSVNKVGVNPKTFQFVSTKHLTEISKNTDVVSDLPKPVVETVSTPVLKDYTVIEPYVDDPASPVKPKPIITVPIEIIPSPELPKKESVAETPHVTTECASTTAKQGKTPRSVFLNGAVKQISTPVRHDAELKAGKIDEISKNKDISIDSNKNVLDQCPSVIKAKNIVVGVMESVFSMTQKTKKVSKLKPNVNRVQKNPRNISVGSTLECQTYNTTLNDILFGFDEIDDFTDECTSSLNSSSETSAVTPVSDASNNILDSSPSWQPDEKEINAFQLANDKSGLSFSDEKQSVNEHSEKDRKKRKLFESPHNSDTWSASECENENDRPRKKKLNPKKKRSSKLVSNLQKVTRNDVKANICSESEMTVDNISVHKSLNDSLKINPSVSPKKLKHAEKRTVKTSDKSPISTSRLQELPYVSPISNNSELSVSHSESSDKIVKGVLSSPSLRNRRNNHDRADRSSIKNKSMGRVGNESFSESVPNFNRKISKRLSRYKISSAESKKGGKFMKSNFKSGMKNKCKRKTLIRSKKKLSKPDDIIREIKTITGGNIPRSKSKKISYSSASEKESNDPELDALSDDSESEICSSKLRNNSPGRANSRKKVRTLKVLFKRAKRKKSSSNQSMDFNPLSISVLDSANSCNSMSENNKSLNSTFREGEREKMDTSYKAESKSENDTFVCETEPEYFINENNEQCGDATHQVASPVKNFVNTDILKEDGTEFVVSTGNSADDEVNSNSIEVQDIRNLLLKIVETISCEPIYTSDFDKESINSNFNNSIPELEVDSNKNLVNLPSVNENINLNVDVKGENSVNCNTIDATSSIMQNLNTELYKSTINVAHSRENLLENRKPRMANRKCPKIKISISKTVIDTDGREESWYISERKPSTDSVQSEVSSEEAKVENEAEIICDKLNIMPEASRIPAISEKDISQSVTRTCNESLEHLIQGANNNNSNTDVSSNIVEYPDMNEDIPHFSNKLSECEVTEQQCPDGQQQLVRSECSVKAFDSFVAKDEESVESINPNEVLNTSVTESGDLAKPECSIEALGSSVIESEVSMEAKCSVEAASSAVESEKQVKPEHSVKIVSSDVENEEPVKSEYSKEEINSAVESEEPTKSEYSLEVVSSEVENEDPVKSEIVDTSEAKKEEPVIECSVKNPSETSTNSMFKFHKELSVTLEVMHNFTADIKSPKSIKRKRNSVPLRTSGRSNVKVTASPDCSGKEQTNTVEKKSLKLSPDVTPVRKKNYDPEAVTVPFTMGWMRELVRRANQEEGRRQADIYYFAPEGVKLRSMREVEAYLSKKGNYALTIENFTYAKELIYREPFEIERSAKQKASVCSTPSPSPNLSSFNTSKRKQQTVSKKQTPPTHSKKQTPPTHSKKQTLLTYSSSSKEHSSKSPKNDTLETARNSGTRKSTRRTSLNIEECVKKENEDGDSIKPRPSRKIIKKVPFDNSFEEKSPVRKCRLDYKQNSSTENKTSAPVILSDSSTKSSTHLSANQSGKLCTSPSSNTENTSSVNLPVDKQSSIQPPKTRKRYKVKCTYSKTDSMVQRPCTPLCRVAHYQFPSVQCAICLCLFHPSCVPPVSRGVKFACKPCTIVKLESNRLRINSPTASIPIDEINDASLESIDSSLLEPEVICQTYSAALPVNCTSDCTPGVPYTHLSVPNPHFENSQKKIFYCCSYSTAPTIANNPLSNYSSNFGEVRSTLNQLKILSSSTMPAAHGLTSSQTFPSSNSSFNFTSLSSHQQKCLGIPRAALNNPVSCRYMIYNIKKPTASNICSGLQHSSMNQNMSRPVLQKNASEFSSVRTPLTVLTEQLKRPSYTYSRNEALYNTSVPSCSYQTSKSFVQGMEMECVSNPTKKTKFSVTPESNSTNMWSNHTSIQNNVSASKTISSDIPRTALSSANTDLKSVSVEDNCRDYVENALNVIVSANNNSKTCEESSEKSEALCSKHQLICEKLSSDHTSSSSEEATVNDCKYLPFVFKMLNICDLLRASQVCRSWRDIASENTLWEKVSFCGQRVTDWDKCCQALKKHCTKSLDLCGIILEDSSDPWEDLERNVVHLGEVEELSFDKVSPSLVISVANNMPRLRILECPFVTVSFTEPEMWFVTCGLELSSLRFLGRLEHLKIGSAGGIVLNGSSLSLMPYLPNLRHVALTGFKFYSTGNLECLAQMQQLISLELGDCAGIEPGIYVLLGKMRRLKKLRLENGGNVKDIKFAEALSKMERLEQLELMNFQMPSLYAVLSELQHLEQINIWPDNATEGPLVNYNSYEAISRCKNLKYICWGIIAEGDTIPEILELKASASENEIKKLTYKQLFQKLVELFPKIKVEVKCVPRELWREFCSTRK